MTEETRQKEQTESRPENGKVAVRSEAMVAQSFGPRAEVREMYDRLTSNRPSWLNPQTPPQALLSLASVSLSHGLDPWLGEIWIIYNEKKGEWSLMVGIKGLRKTAADQLPDREQYYPRFVPIKPGSEEWNECGLDDNVLMAEKCYITRTDTLTNFANAVEKMCAAGGQFMDVVAMLGGNPTYEGIGIVRVGEKSRMELKQLLDKRAEADALKKAFHVPFDVDTNGGAPGNYEAAVNGEIIEGDTPKVIPFPSPEPEPAVEVPDRPAEPPALRVYFKSLVAASKITNGISQAQSGGVLGLIARMFENDKPKRHTLLYYLSGKEDIKKWSGAEASAFIEIFKAPGDSWNLHEHAQVEVERILRLHAEEQGQLDMFDQKPDEEPKPAPAKEEAKPAPKPAQDAKPDDQSGPLNNAGEWLKKKTPDTIERACRWLTDRLSLNWTPDTALAEASSELGIKPSEVDITKKEHWHALVKAAVERARI